MEEETINSRSLWQSICLEASSTYNAPVRGTHDFSQARCTDDRVSCATRSVRFEIILGAVKDEMEWWLGPGGEGRNNSVLE